MTVASTKGVPVSLLNAVTTGTGIAVTVPISSKNPRFHIRSIGTITGGTIVLEEAYDPDYAGTWSVLQTIAALPFDGGDEQVIHYSMTTLNAVRARVTANITGGGNMSVDLVSD